MTSVVEAVRGHRSIDAAEMIAPAVMRKGDVAVLTFNLIGRGASLNGSPKRDVKWNSTEVYRFVDGQWKIAHSHWSLTTPPLAQPERVAKRESRRGATVSAFSASEPSTRR